MIKVRCPICARTMQGHSAQEWPSLPFCSERCRLIDLGRWLGEAYRIPAEPEGEAPTETEDNDIP